MGVKVEVISYNTSEEKFARVITEDITSEIDLEIAGLLVQINSIQANIDNLTAFKTELTAKRNALIAAKP